MTAPYYSDDQGVTLYHGDCLEVMRSLPEYSVHAIVTDPPYGLGFMGKAWDDLPPGLDFAVEAFRVLKPGGHMLAFGGTRTWHRLAVAVEDAGFEIRDSIAWLYGAGFPKSLDVSKAIDKMNGADRDVIGPGRYASRRPRDSGPGSTYGEGLNAPRPPETAPASREAIMWDGWGTGLKPAFEPIVVARKPFTGTVATNVLAYSTGALNIDATRVAGTGRWPTSVLLDESQAAELDKQSGADNRNIVSGDTYADAGGASRFFPTFHYEAKAPGSERPDVDGTQHPTVKPLDLMRWLVRLVAPPGATILEPFAGSGTTLEACLIEGFNVVGIEREDAYLPLIMQRIKKPLQQSLFGDFDLSSSTGDTA